MLFGFYYGESEKFSLTLYNRDHAFKKEFIAEKWYTVGVLTFINYKSSISSDFKKLFQMKITQIKEEEDKCNVKGWWQNELVVNASFVRRNYDAGIGLYACGRYSRVTNGQVRNFSFIKK